MYLIYRTNPYKEMFKNVKKIENLSFITLVYSITCTIVWFSQRFEYTGLFAFLFLSSSILNFLVFSIFLLNYFRNKRKILVSFLRLSKTLFKNFFHAFSNKFFGAILKSENNQVENSRLDDNKDDEYKFLTNLREELARERKKNKHLQTLNYLLLKQIKKIEVKNPSNTDVYLDEPLATSSRRIIRETHWRENLFEAEMESEENLNIEQNFTSEVFLDKSKISRNTNLIQGLKKSLKGSLYSDYFLKLKFKLCLDQNLAINRSNLFIRIKPIAGKCFIIYFLL